MNRHTALSVRMLLVTLITSAFTLVVVPASNTQSNSPPSADKPVEQTRKNIQVLQGLPDSQLFLAMNFVSDSLGVHCDYCRVKEADKWLWDRDDKKPKSVGRDMMRMVLELNKAKVRRSAGRDLLQLSSWQFASGTNCSASAARLC